MSTVGSYAAHIPLDKYTKDTFSIAPLPYPTISILQLITPPSEELSTSRMAIVATTSAIIVHDCALCCNDIGKHLLHIIRSKFVAIVVRLRAYSKQTAKNKQNKGKSSMLHLS